MTTTPETPAFKVGDAVEKVGGDYSYQGIVRAAMQKASGAIRYVVEDARGMLFIFNEKSLRLQVNGSAGEGGEAMAPHRCGDANPKGNIGFQFKGGCMKDIPLEDAYRCTGCGGWFHRDCIFTHFQVEEHCSVAHHALNQLLSIAYRYPLVMDTKEVIEICERGLDKSFQRKTFLP